MKKWEIALLIAFFMVFAILFFAAGDFQLLRQTKTSRIGEIIHIDDVFIRFQQLSVDDSVCYFFSINESYEPYPIGQCYEAGEGWKFVILNIFIANDAKEDITFHVGCMEDENGAVYYDYMPPEPETIRPYRPYYIIVPSKEILRYPIHRYPYGSYIKVAPGRQQKFAIAYRLPLNAVPEKFHYKVSNSKWYYGEVILKK